MLVLEVTVQNKLKFPPPPSPSPWSISNSKVGGLFTFLHIFLKQGCETMYNQVYNGCLFFRNFSWTFDLHPPYIELSFRGSRKRILINSFLWKFANLFWQSPDTCMIHGQQRVSGYWAGRGDTRLIGLSQETKFRAETKLSLEAKKCEIRNFFLLQSKKMQQWRP